MKRIIRVETTEDEKTLNARIEVLSTIVGNLEEQKKGLDTSLENHQFNELEYKRVQILLSQINKDIGERTIILEQVTEEMGKVSALLFEAKKELEYVNGLNQKKGLLLKDIDRYQENIILLQKDMERYIDEFNEIKRKKEEDLRTINGKINSLHESIKEIMVK